MSAAKAKEELESEISLLYRVESCGAEMVSAKKVREELERIVNLFDAEDTDDEW